VVWALALAGVGRVLAWCRDRLPPNHYRDRAGRWMRPSLRAKWATVQAYRDVRPARVLPVGIVRCRWDGGNGWGGPPFVVSLRASAWRVESERAAVALFEGLILRAGYTP
jgi:hypothetical protein